jgi:pectinesterase
MRYLTPLLSLLTATVCANTSPPGGALVVGSSSSAKYKTLQAAVTAASPGAKIFIEAGTYNEQVYIPVTKTNLVIIGSSASNDSYTSNTVTITQKLAQDSSNKPNNDGTATLRAWGDGLKVYNVNFVNTRGQGSQALALSAYGDRMGFYGCQFKGFQDTVMSQQGTHYIGRSLIVGATDFIFGQKGLLWIEKSVLQVVSANTGYVTGKLLLSYSSAWYSN